MLVEDVETEANSLVNQEELNLRQTIRGINSQVGLNNIEKEQLIAQAYQTAQDKVDEIDNYIAQLKYSYASSNTTSDNSTKNQIVDLVDEVLGSNNLKGVTGVSIANKIPGTSSYDLQKKIDQIKNKLTVEERAKLKGQGQISDRETQMLENAVTALDSGMSETAFRTELQNIKDILNGKYSDSNYSNNSLTNDQISYILGNL